jgi:hypothetical protein
MNILIATSESITKAQADKVRSAFGVDCPVKVVEPTALVVDEARVISAGFGPDGILEGHSGVRIHLAIRTGEMNPDGTQRSARGWADISQPSEELVQYAYHIDGYVSRGGVVLRAETATFQKNRETGRLESQSRSWYSLGLLSGTVVALVGDEQETAIPGRTRLPIEKVALVGAEFGSTLGQVQVAEVVDLAGIFGGEAVAALDEF